MIYSNADLRHSIAESARQFVLRNPTAPRDLALADLAARADRVIGAAERESIINDTVLAWRA